LATPAAALPMPPLLLRLLPMLSTPVVLPPLRL
jgi:hypothetical protein